MGDTRRHVKSMALIPTMAAAKLLCCDFDDETVCLSVLTV